MADFSDFSNILSSMRLPKTVKDHLKNHDLWVEWPQIVGPELTRVTQPRELKGKTLVVTVAHQAWAHQLHFLTPSILTKIKALFPKVTIQNLNYVVGDVDPIELKKSVAFQQPTAPIQLSERLEMTLRAIEDDELRSTIRRAMEASVRHQVKKTG